MDDRGGAGRIFPRVCNTGGLQIKKVPYIGLLCFQVIPVLLGKHSFSVLGCSESPTLGGRVNTGGSPRKPAICWRLQIPHNRVHDWADDEKLMRVLYISGQNRDEVIFSLSKMES